MLFNSQECVKRDLNLQKNILKRYKEQLKKLPKGSLYASERNGVKYYTKVTNFRGKKRSVYLGKEINPQVQLLQKKYYLRKAIQAMESNISLMEKFLNGYQSIDPNVMQKQFPKAYQSLPQSCFDTAGVFNLDRWGSEFYVKSTSRSENLLNSTKKGDKVRSKSEVIIANAVAVRGLQYRYEEVTYINGYKKAPDFKVIDPRTGRIIYWEHLGLITDMEYLKQALFRIADYIRDGIVPGVNLILTFDDAENHIDSLMIERTLDLWFGAAA